MTIVTSTYRYKRPPRKRKPVALEVPVIGRAATPKKGRRPLRRIQALIRWRAQREGDNLRFASHFGGR